MKQVILKLCLICLIGGMLAACGKRPSTVDAPAGSDPTAYPRTYPAE